MNKTAKFRAGNLVMVPDNVKMAKKFVPAFIWSTYASDVCDGDISYLVTYVNDEDETLRSKTVNENDIHPVLLNQRLLKMLGFKRESEDVFVFPSDRYRILLDLTEYSFHVLYCKHTMLDFVKVDYVHQVQNLLANEWLLDEMPIIDPLEVYMYQKANKKT